MARGLSSEILEKISGRAEIYTVGANRHVRHGMWHVGCKMSDVRCHKLHIRLEL